MTPNSVCWTWGVVLSLSITGWVMSTEPAEGDSGWCMGRQLGGVAENPPSHSLPALISKINAILMLHEAFIGEVHMTLAEE